MSGPSAAMIQGSTGVDVKGSEFITSAKDTNVHKSYYNLNIVFSDVTGFFNFATKHVVEWIGSKDRDPVEISDIVSPDPSSLPPVSSIADRYTRCMLECMVGYPLYNPKPFSELSMEYPRNGVNVGDVGFVRRDGDFDFLFNICLPQKSFINPFNLPDDFLLETPDHSTTKALESFPDNKCLIPRTVKLTKSGEYICEGSDGAVLELPKGAIQDEAMNTRPFEMHAARHGVQWYEYAMARGRSISNGSLYLVTSFTKCTQWGIAVFDRPCDLGEGLTFVSSPLGWKGSRVFTTKVAEPNQGDTSNQCVFLRGYKIKLRQDIFDNLYNDQPRGSDSALAMPSLSSQARSSSLNLTRQPAQRIRGGGGTDLLSKILTVGKSSTSTTKSAVKKTDEVVLQADFISSPFHPSDVINATLLSQNPDAKIAITHDDVWCNLMRDNFPTLDYATLISIAQSYTERIDEYGCVSLEKIFASSDVIDERSHAVLGTRAAVIRDLKKPGIFFPLSWDESRTRQRNRLLTLPQLSLLSGQLNCTDPLAILPREVVLQILGYLDAASLCRAAQVTHKWKALADDDVLWHGIGKQHIVQKCEKCGWGLPLLEKNRSYRLRSTSPCSPTLDTTSSPSPLASSTKRTDDDIIEPPSWAEKWPPCTSEHPNLVAPLASESSLATLAPWMDVYDARMTVEHNWRRGRCTVRIFKGHTDGVMCLQFNENLSHPAFPILITGSYDCTVRIWNLETGAELHCLKGHTRAVRCLQFDEAKLITGSMDNTIKVWDWQRGTCTRTLTGHSNGVVCLNFDSSVLASGGVDSTIRVWNFCSGDSFTLRGHSDWVNAVQLWDSGIEAVSSNKSASQPSQIGTGKMLFSASDDGTIKLWDVILRTCIRQFTGHVGQVQSIKLLQTKECDEDGASKGWQFASSSDHRIPLLISGSLDNTVKIWDIVSGNALKTFFGHIEGVWTVACDKLRLVSGSHDKTIKVWSRDDGRCITTLVGHKAGVSCIALGEDKIVSGGDDADIRIWSFGG